ncbi:MAG TPA: hypothetical protein VH601_13935 [Bryobacteraceae bacterium]
MIQTVKDLAELIRHYYGHRAVRERILEFLGQSPIDHPSAVYVCGTDGGSDPCRLELLPVFRLNEFLGRDCEIGRSLWDRQFLIADLDIDYENFDSAVEPYLNANRIFQILQPVVKAAISILGVTGIQPLHLLGGRGHHLVWAIRRDSRAFGQLADLGHVPLSLMALYERKAIEFGETIDLRLARAFAGLGMLLEFVAHSILSMAPPHCSVPIQLTAVEVGPINGRREIVSLDISEYGDPFHLRHIRVPFSLYLKLRSLTWCLGQDGVRQLLPLFEIPLGDMSLEDALRVRCDPQAVVDLATKSSVRIPDESEESLNLLLEYKKSDLASHHQDFHSDQLQLGSGTKSGVNSYQPKILPPCARWILEHPNDWLLKPGGVQHVTRTLMALGWPSRQIADLVRTQYNGDFGWNDRWLRYDAAWRAMFYVRLFSGLIEAGKDQLIDFNCVSHKEKGYCPIAECGWNLVPYQEALIRRRQHGELENRPVDRLLLEGKDF